MPLINPSYHRHHNKMSKQLFQKLLIGCGFLSSSACIGYKINELNNIDEIKKRGAHYLLMIHPFFITEKTEVRPTPRHDYFRSMLILQKHAAVINQSGMSIKDHDNEYTQEFIELIPDYSFHL